MFKGVFTAIVTPFHEDGTLDLFRYRELINHQIKNGVDGIVPVGTTGESPTLTMEEHIEVIKECTETCRDQVKVIAGTGANSTAEAIELTQAAKELGVHGTLQVTPYYNKPTDAGLIKHFSKIADIGVPSMLYNVPGRTAKALSINLIKELAGHEHVVAVKEAGGSVDRVTQIKQACDITVLSGDDPLTLPMMLAGAEGVVSVASNLIPREVSNLVQDALGGRWDVAAEQHREWYKLFSTLFVETNPLPVKTALAMMGKVGETFRLPLCRMGDSKRQQLEEVLRDYKLI